MRIEAYTQVQQLYNTKKTSKPQAAEKRGLSDQLQISSIGKDIQTAKAAVAGSSDIREDVIAPIKEKLRNGTYEVSNESFADKLFAKYEEMNLIEVLNNESQEYDQLLELSTKKTPVLVAGNLEELAKITDEEQLVVSRITHLERKRQEVFADIANVINRDVKTLLLPDLIEILAQRPEEQQKLAKVHDRLRTVVHEVKRVNDQNRILIQNSLEMIDYDLNMLQSMKSAPETANYNRGAYNTGAQMGVETSAFDAKQ